MCKMMVTKCVARKSDTLFVPAISRIQTFGGTGSWSFQSRVPKPELGDAPKDRQSPRS